MNEKKGDATQIDLTYQWEHFRLLWRIKRNSFFLFIFYSGACPLILLAFLILIFLFSSMIKEVHDKW